jgi:hypothetical protein
MMRQHSKAQSYFGLAFVWNFDSNLKFAEGIISFISALLKYLSPIKYSMIIHLKTMADLEQQRF